MTNINVNYHANGGLAGATDYTMDADAQHRVPAWRRPLLRVHRKGQVELYGQANNATWAALVEAMMQDRFSVKGSSF